MNCEFFKCLMFLALHEMPEHIQSMLMMTEISRVDFQLFQRVGLIGKSKSTTLPHRMLTSINNSSIPQGLRQLPQNQQATGHPHPQTQ